MKNIFENNKIGDVVDTDLGENNSRGNDFLDLNNNFYDDPFSYKNDPFNLNNDSPLDCSDDLRLDRATGGVNRGFLLADRRDTSNSTRTDINENNIDPNIEKLDLSENARRGAYYIKKLHPEVKFTSGRRTEQDQAGAMAENVVENRKWIEQTYKKSIIRDECQKWINEHPDINNKSGIQKGLLKVFDKFKDKELNGLSKHLTGNAFDIQPVEKNATAIKKSIRGLDGLDKFLEKEGGLVRWHVQFK